MLLFNENITADDIGPNNFNDKNARNNNSNRANTNRNKCGAATKNITDQPVTLEVGERIVQGVFMPFLIVDGDEADGVRTGGFGSTGQ